MKSKLVFSILCAVEGLIFDEISLDVSPEEAVDVLKQKAADTPDFLLGQVLTTDGLVHYNCAKPL